MPRLTRRRKESDAICEHRESEAGGIHIAFLRKADAATREGAPSGTIVASFAIRDLAGFLARLADWGVAPLHPIVDLGEGKRICTIPDLDGNTVRLIHIG